MYDKPAFVMEKEDLWSWFDQLSGDFQLFGPVLRKKGETVFENVHDIRQLHLDYRTTMTSPRKFIYPSRQDLFHTGRFRGKSRAVFPLHEKKVIIGIHPCDMHAVSILDRVFLGDIKDSYFKRQRENTLTVVLNCSRACDTAYPSHMLQAFCASMGAGPFLNISNGHDIELTSLEPAEKGSIPENASYLAEAGSPAGEKIIKKAGNLRRAGKEELDRKHELQRTALSSFQKTLETDGLPELLFRSLDHPVYKETAESRCLGCTNCTMVCPTCYCYDIEDYTTFNLKRSERKRRWDSCLDLNFAKVNLGNFRSSREARLRQFVTHKLSNWIEQYGCFGCVGCGRCMTWCPTNIDLTEISEEIRKYIKEEKAP